MRWILSSLSIRSSWRLCRVFALGAMLGCLGSAGAQDASSPTGKGVPTGKGGQPAPGTEKDPAFKLDTPSPEAIFRLQGERAFLDTARRELRDVTKTTEVPQDVRGPSPRRPLTGDAMPPQLELFVPHVVCHHPLYFEQRRPERFAKYFPPVQPVISATRFYTDTALLPFKMMLQPPWRYRCNTDDPSHGPDPLSPLRR